MSESTDIFAIQQLIARFANSFDMKDWATLGNCLADELHTDYSGLRGTAPERMSREKFVELRQAALQPLQTHHLSGNVEIALSGASAEAKVSMVIYRRSEGGETLNTHCLYTFGLQNDANGWVIGSIIQKVFMNDGQAAIHKGILRS